MRKLLIILSIIVSFNLNSIAQKCYFVSFESKFITITDIKERIKTLATYQKNIELFIRKDKHYKYTIATGMHETGEIFSAININGVFIYDNTKWLATENPINYGNAKNDVITCIYNVMNKCYDKTAQMSPVKLESLCYSIIEWTKGRNDHKYYLYKYGCMETYIL